MTTEGKIIISLLVVLNTGGAFAYCNLEKRVKNTEFQASSCHCPYDTSGQAALSEIGRYGQAEISSHSYAERLLEGLVRHAGLPIEEAREQMRKDRKYPLPPNWRWLKPWEGTKTPAPATPRPAAPSPMRP